MSIAGFKKLPVKHGDGTYELLEMESVFFLEAHEGDTLIRTARKKMYRSVQEISRLEKLLPSPPFVRCHRSFIVNVNRVRAIQKRGSDEYDFKMDPPVNRRVPISRYRIKEIRKLLGL